MRYALKENGTTASLEEFYEIYSRNVVDNIDDVGGKNSEEIIKDGPPCLQALCGQGFPPGTRNNGLFNIGVYTKKFDPDNWERLLEEYNQKVYATTTRSQRGCHSCSTLNKKGYQYKCKDQPISSFCNVNVCKTRKARCWCRECVTTIRIFI